jgi:hypothetical protein
VTVRKPKASAAGETSIAQPPELARFGALPAEVKTVCHVDYGDFDRYVQAVYGKDYEVAAVIESSNDTSHEYNGVDGKLDDYDERKLKAWRDGGRDWPWPRVLLDDMCRRGLTPPGDYIIRVSW